MKTEKYCRKCRKKKPLTEFYKHGSTKDGYVNQCKTCKRKYSKGYRKLIIKNIVVKYIKPVQVKNRLILDVNNAPVITF
jgi:hypothetical protein